MERPPSRIVVNVSRLAMMKLTMAYFLILARRSRPGGTSRLVRRGFGNRVEDTTLCVRVYLPAERDRYLLRSVAVHRAPHQGGSPTGNVGDLRCYYWFFGDPWHFLNFFPLPHEHGSFRAGLRPGRALK